MIIVKKNKTVSFSDEDETIEHFSDIGVDSSLSCTSESSSSYNSNGSSESISVDNLSCDISFSSDCTSSTSYSSTSSSRKSKSTIQKVLPKNVQNSRILWSLLHKNKKLSNDLSTECSLHHWRKLAQKCKISKQQAKLGFMDEKQRLYLCTPSGPLLLSTKKINDCTQNENFRVASLLEKMKNKHGVINCTNHASKSSTILNYRGRVIGMIYNNSSVNGSIQIAVQCYDSQNSYKLRTHAELYRPGRKLEFCILRGKKIIGIVVKNWRWKNMLNRNHIGDTSFFTTFKTMPPNDRGCIVAAIQCLKYS